MPRFVAAALEGNLLDRLPEIVRACRLQPVGDVRYSADWASVAPFARRTDYLAAAVSGNWTVLVDDWNVTGYLFDHPEVCAELAKRYRVRVVSSYAQSVSAGCGYRVHSRGGELARSVVVLQDEVLEDLGPPLPGEDASDLEQHDMYSVLDVLGLIGLDLADGVEASAQCAFVQLVPTPGPQS